MPTAIIYTTIESIRACAGLDEADVDNTFINNMNLRLQFMLDLDSWYEGSYTDDWEASQYDPTAQANEVTQIQDSERKGFLLSNYAMWFGAHRLLETLLAIPQKISDGDNVVQRFNGIDLEKMLLRVDKNLSTTKNSILKGSASAATINEGSVLGVSRVTSTTYDPITGV